MALSCVSLQVNSSGLRPFVSHNVDQLKTSLSSTFKGLPKKINNISKTILQNTSRRLLDAFVDSTFHFVDQPYPPSQSNMAPVEEIGEEVEVTCIQGQIPEDFPEGGYIRNGANPLFGGLKSAVSVFGKTNQIWVEGEGMLHALFFRKNGRGNWSITYKNKYVESATFKIETERNSPVFLPAVEGDPLAILMSSVLNMLRHGAVSKHYQNINVVHHSGKLYTASDNCRAQEIDIRTLESLDDWDMNGGWDRPFTGHPKKAPSSGELVTMGVDGQKPYWVVGVVSADGSKLLHKVDLNLNRSVLSHEIGVTQNYNVLIDHPLVVDPPGILKGGPLIEYDKEGDARIGVMPRYGDADSIKWFVVEPNCTFHIVNSFEDGDEVVVRGCRASTSIVPGPNWGTDKFEWFSRGFKFTDVSPENGYLFHCVHEWRLNMVTGEVHEKNLTGTDFSMDFPCISENVIGLKHKYAYTQVIDSVASSTAGLSKYGGLAKLHFDEEEEEEQQQQQIKVEYHNFPENVFCTGSIFVGKQGGVEEDDGWIITFVHNEETNVSQAYIIDAKKFESEPIAKISMPQRVPYGHHGIFVPIPNQA